MESTYCTVTEVTTYANANGERGWYSLASIDLTGAVNLVAGYAAGSRTMIVDGFTDSVNPISAGDKFTLASDSTATVYTVIGSQFASGTVELTFYPGLAESVADNDVINFTTARATDEQTRCVVKATKDIVRYHKQLNVDGSLWQPTNTDLNKAAILQSIHLARVLDMRDRSTVVKEITQTEFDDGDIVIQNPAGPTMDADAAFLIEKCMREYRSEIEANESLFPGGKPYYGR
jgi:hypothetical protein